jgi:iron complex outermembrane recepter protein
MRTVRQVVFRDVSVGPAPCCSGIQQRPYPVAGLAFVADDPNQQATLHSSMNLGESVTWDAYLREVGMLPHPGVPAYVELDTRVGWNITGALQLSVSGFNLLHARHREFLEGGASTDVPRSVLVQGRVRF